LPRGIRNHNPGNIERDGTRWQGMAAEQTDRRFVVFSAPKWGLRAMARILITYQDKRRAADGSRIDSVRKFVSRWAPPAENNTDAYAAYVASALGVGPDDRSIDVYDYTTMLTLLRSIVQYENGISETGEDWYRAEEYDAALTLAGIVRGARHGDEPRPYLMQEADDALPF